MQMLFSSILLLLLWKLPLVAAENHLSNYSIRNVFVPPESYYKDTYIFVPSDLQAESREVYSILEKTSECTTELGKLEGENEKDSYDEELKNCPPGLIDLSVSPTYVARSHISFPFATMNISVTSHSSFSSVFVRLDCLYAETGDDKYCHPSESSLVNGKRQLPCRSLKINPKNGDNIQFPLRFSYTGFRLFPHSIYSVNATIFPQNCKASLVLTSPPLQNLFPNALMDPDHAAANSLRIWSPMSIVDFSDNDGVWIRVGKAEHFYCDRIIINILQQVEGSLEFIKSLEILCPNTGVKWENVKQGTYIIVTYAPLNGCKYRCQPGESHCIQCLQTHLNVTIPYDRTSTSWKAVQTLKDSSNTIVISAIVITVILLCAAVGYVTYLKLKKPEDPTELELNQIVKVLLIYSDDCAEHSNCVASVADCLRCNANAEVLLDMEQLNVPGAIPSRWLVDAFCQSEKHLIFVSQCSVRMLETDSSHTLVQNRPFPDIFVPAMDMVIREATYKSSESTKKFAIIRLPYSPPTPRSLEILGLPTFLLPDQFAQVTAFLHDVDATDNYTIQQNLRQDLVESLKSAVKNMTSMMESTPNWMEERWKEKELSESEDREALATHTKRNGDVMSGTAMKEAAERLNLLPPDSDSEEEKEKEEKKEVYKKEEQKTLQVANNDEEDVEKQAKAKMNGTSSTPFVLYEPSDSESD